MNAKIGDYVIIEGCLERISVCRSHSRDIQTTDSALGSWFLNSNGCADFSGTAINMKRSRDYDLISKDNLREIGTEPGDFWRFKNGVVGPSRREDFVAQCRVFRNYVAATQC